MIADWFRPTIALAPAALWMFFGVGLPWALVLLPRPDRRDMPMVLALTMALGPALTTTALFIIGSFATFSAVGVLAASVAIFLLGCVAAWRSGYRGPLPEKWSALWSGMPPSALDSALIAVTVVALLLRFWNTAYWPFATYDEFWVYGYNARVFMLEGAIPRTMGYYPQLLPLSYTYMQLLWGGIDDHAARVVLPYFASGGALMAYLLGARLFNRRVGLLTAAIWALYPQHAAWSQFGDLEVPLTLYFTGTVAFFALGWRENRPRYIVLSGLLMGAALWTKPTAGALVQSAVLVGIGAALAAVVPRLGRGTAYRALAYPLLALAAAFPMGGMWYIRNVFFGHPPLVFPEGYWQNEAQRSGQELGWLLLIAVAAALWLTLRRQPRALAGMAGAGLLLIASLPSALGGRFPTLDELRRTLVGQVVSSIRPTPLGVAEYALLALGGALLVWALLPVWRRLAANRRATFLIVGAFIAPYFVTWFWSYSYHYRLSFAIVPSLIVLLAVLLDSLSITRYPSQLAVRGRRGGRLIKLATLILVIALALPGWWAVLTAAEPAAAHALPDDDSKMAYGNPALMGLVGFLRQQRAALARPMRVIAPGELRLNFFFPQDDIRGDEYPTLLDQIADVDFYIDSSVSHRLYAYRNMFYNQIIASRTRLPVMQRVYTVDDGNFRFSVYTLNNSARFISPQPNGKLNATVGDFAFLWGHDLSTLRTYQGEALYLTLWWQALKPASLDYSVFIHLVDPVTGKASNVWGGEPVTGAFSVWDGVPGEHFSVAYHTRLWQPGEIIMDEWKVRVALDTPPGQYELRTGLFDPISGQRLPITQDGRLIGDSILLNVVEIALRQ